MAELPGAGCGDARACALAWIVVLLGVSPVGAYWAGGGKDAGKGNDCLIGYDGVVTWQVTRDGKKYVYACTDCDPSCDQDGVTTPNGACTIAIGACLNRSGVEGCAPPAVLDQAAGAGKVKGVKGSGGKILIELPPFLEGSRCGTLVAAVVPIKETKKGPKDGKATVRLSASVRKSEEAPARSDKDKVTILCVPRSVGAACPVPTTTTSTSTLASTTFTTLSSTTSTATLPSSTTATVASTTSTSGPSTSVTSSTSTTTSSSTSSTVPTGSTVTIPSSSTTSSSSSATSTTSTTTSTSTTTTTSTSTTICVLTDGTFCDLGNGTVLDSATGLQWERKNGAGGGPDPANLRDVNNRYAWAGTCSLASTVICQPNAAASATCGGRTGGALGCTECGATEGSCTMPGGAITTIWDWVNQLNAVAFGGHADWRPPTSGGPVAIPTGQAAELESIVDQELGLCGGGAGPCISPIFGASPGAVYWTASTHSTVTANAWTVYFTSGNVLAPVKASASFVRAVRRSS